MIEHILPVIKDTADYLTALSLYKANEPLTSDEAAKLLAVYAKYQSQVENQDDLGFLKMCVAVDLLPGRTEEDAADFAALEIGSATLNTLFTAKKLVAGSEDLTTEAAARIVEQVQDETVLLPARVMLARIALDIMTGARNFVELQAQIRELAAFLTGISTETLDRYTTLVGEAWMKCRN